MARSLRIEYPGAVYHVLNRGNYKTHIFSQEKAKQSFEDCLFNACVRYRWRLYAYCLLSNHYHIAVETSEANLSQGMQWLQSTFANRFNRAHLSHGHLFQGRFKSLVVERDEYLGPLIHYIHLNPIRANLVQRDSIETYRWSTLWYLLRKRKRNESMELEHGLYYAGNLPDTMKGRRIYLQHLLWIPSDIKAKRRIQSSRLCRGWALGNKQFKEELVDRFLPVGQVGHLEGKDFSEANEIRWNRILEKCLTVMEKDSRDIRMDKKTVHWKSLIALFMKDNTSVSNVWLTKHLNMGIPQGVSRSTRKLAESKGRKHKKYIEMRKITA
jgi:REP element-mobilizing transposase RayT